MQAMQHNGTAIDMSTTCQAGRIQGLRYVRDNLKAPAFGSTGDIVGLSGMSYDNF